jgi:hypothetical protein
LLLAVIVTLVLALLTPWWSESEAFGTNNWSQNFSPLTGVTGECSPSCGPFNSGPPVGPIEGTQSFSSLGLNQTEQLYDVSLVLVGVGLASTCLTLVFGRVSANQGSSLRRERIATLSLSVALLALALGSTLLPVLQPTALRADTLGKFTAHNAWTASPSPETSFWGGCSVGQYNGACASGGSAIWGPGPGWYLLVVAVALLIVLHIRATQYAKSSSSSTGTDSEPSRVSQGQQRTH